MKWFLLRVARLSWPVQGLLVCAAFLVVGSGVADDYGTGWDTEGQRHIAAMNLDFMTGRSAALAPDLLRFYGVAFELPLFLIERGLGLEDSRTIYLIRHLVTHLFFLAGGWCGSLLVYRLFHSKGTALVVLLLFVLSPRLYAHSFFNSKDLPFLSMFMVSLYVTHRAFRRETLGAFVLCGVSVGVLTNLRIIGLTLFPAVLALRGLDLVQANPERREYVLATGGVFAVTGLSTLYIISPYLWDNPFDLVTAVWTLAHHPIDTPELFQGKMIVGNEVFHFIPTWLAISTPPVTLLLGVLGATIVGRHSVRRAREALRNTDLRFGLLFLAYLTSLVVAICVSDSPVSWRHMFFLHAPLCLLGGYGLHWTMGTHKAVATGAYALAGFGLLVTVVAMVRLHPYQHNYFNLLVNRTPPGYLGTNYEMYAWHRECHEGLMFLRRRYPDTTVHVRDGWSLRGRWELLPVAERRRVNFVLKGADFDILCGSRLQRKMLKGRRGPRSFADALFVHEIYNTPLVVVTARVTVPEKNRRLAGWLETYQGATSGKLLVRDVFDIYMDTDRRALGYVKDDCTALDRMYTVFVHVYPTAVHDLPKARRQHGFDNLDFYFQRAGSWAGEQCLARVELPDYPIARIRTGQYTTAGRIWESEVVWPAGEAEPASRRSH